MATAILNNLNLVPRTSMIPVAKETTTVAKETTTVAMVTTPMGAAILNDLDLHPGHL